MESIVTFGPDHVTYRRKTDSNRPKIEFLPDNASHTHSIDQNDRIEKLSRYVESIVILGPDHVTYRRKTDSNRPKIEFWPDNALHTHAIDQNYRTVKLN